MIEPNFNLTKEDILSNVDEVDIFERYLGVSVDTSSSYVNPYRGDKDPGCRFYYSSNSRLYFKDFSKGFHWDCFNIVQMEYNCSFYKAIQIIAKDFNLIKDESFERGKSKKVQQIKKGKISIKIKIKDWEKKDLEWWNQYKIDEFYDTIEFLTYMGVFPCKSVWIAGGYFRCKTPDPCYAYHLGVDKTQPDLDLIKLYFPFRSYNRFFQNDASVLQGYNKLPETGENLIITKSYKDVIMLRLFGIYAVAPSSETVLIKQEQFADLYNRFDNIFSLMDNDRTGKHMAWMLRKAYEVQPLLFPKDMKKDFSDNLKDIGVMEMNDIIEDTKQLML